MVKELHAVPVTVLPHFGRGCCCDVSSVLELESLQLRLGLTWRELDHARHASETEASRSGRNENCNRRCGGLLLDCEQTVTEGSCDFESMADAHWHDQSVAQMPCGARCGLN